MIFHEFQYIIILVTYYLLYKGERNIFTQIGASLHNYGNEAFNRGVRYGIDFFQEGDWSGVPPTSEQVIQFIKGNILEFQQEGWLDDTRMADLLGFLVGWIIAEYTTVHEEKR